MQWWFWALHYYHRYVCDRLHADRQFNDVVSRGLRNNFDAIVIEPGRWDCLSHIAAESGLPLIYTVPFATAYFVQNYALGAVTNPAAEAPIMTDHAVPRTFGQRFWNAMFTLYDSATLAYLYRSLRTADPKPYDSWLTTTPSLVFVNGYFASNPSQPVPVNIINVGGIHLRPARPIPSVRFSIEYKIYQNNCTLQHICVQFEFEEQITNKSIKNDRNLFATKN